MKSIYLLLFLFLFSCGPAKIKDFNKDYTQDLVGKIKSINIINYEYKFIKKDTVNLVKNTFLNFDSNNNVINEKITTEDNQKETSFKYQNGLLIEKKPILENNTHLTTYKYDKKNNLIEEKEFDDKKVYFLISQVFDKYNNLMEKKLNSFGKIFGITKTEYNYKKKFFVSKTTTDTLTLERMGTQKYFNKKGYIIKSGSTNNTINNNYYTYEIDVKGNLTKKTYYKSDDSIIETVTFNNTYDKKGNIIIRDRFLDGKLIEKNTYDIIYY
ncbi:hypothetical protein [Flavobacterium sp. K5-23]|uniref:hypothetical protein n=1 Tax=Flavobacterium sp. K5-23 TaxID=2746225 RepID=UPI00200DDAD1|nr:hypothetical protein [Flavobacterium sp. K5-23]UQD57066.1 hypothetical protein FLAK523_11975 [Flavobacterium sp. K5-23]